MCNPFDEINARLSNIEDLLLDIKHHPLRVEKIEQPETLLTVEEAAKLLHLSIPTMYGKTHRNELPFMKRGKRLYFSRHELLEYIKAGHAKGIIGIEIEK